MFNREDKAALAKNSDIVYKMADFGELNHYKYVILSFKFI